MWRNVSAFAAGAAVCFAVLLFIVYELLDLLTDWLPVEIWMGMSGSKGLAELSISAATPAIAAVAAYFAYRSYRANHASALVTRFQKAAEMLSADGSPSHTASTKILIGIADEEPALFAEATMITLVAFVERADDQGLADLREAARRRRQPAIWPRHQLAQVEALRALGEIRQRHNGRRSHPHELLEISGLYFSDRSVDDVNMSACLLREAIFHRAYVYSCNFRNTVAHCTVYSSLNFYNCDLRGAQLHVIIASSGSLLDTLYIADNCLIDEKTKINGQPLARFRRDKRVLDEDRQNQYDMEFGDLAGEDDEPDDVPPW